MPARAWTTEPPAGVDPPDLPDVLAVLDQPACAAAVAQAAVREARGRSTRVHFLRSGDAGAAGGEDDGFGAALRALREETRVPVTFETLPGDAAAARRRLWDCARGAGVLVLARDSGAALLDTADPVPCDVLLVGTPVEAAHD